MSQLQVHHIKSRSLLDDTEENLITLCALCHQRIHRRLAGSPVLLLPRRQRPLDLHIRTGHAVVGQGLISGIPKIRHIGV